MSRACKVEEISDKGEKLETPVPSFCDRELVPSVGSARGCLDNRFSVTWILHTDAAFIRFSPRRKRGYKIIRDYENGTRDYCIIIGNARGNLAQPGLKQTNE